MMAAGRRKATSLNTQTPNRAEGLGDWGPPPTPTPKAGALDIEPAPESHEREPRERPKPRRRAQPGRREPIVAGRIAKSLFDGINETKTHTDDTHEAWFARALASTYEEVRDHYRQQVDPTAMFAIPQRRARKPGGETAVQYPLRLPADVRRVFDDLLDELDPPNQSHLMETIVRLRLRQLGHNTP